MTMAEPTSGFLGVKYAALVAGFAGGVVSLSYGRELTRLQSAMAVLSGSLVAAYGTPIAVHYLDLGVGSPLENGIAFGLGLTAMNIIPGVLTLADRWGRNPGLPGGGGK